MKESNRPPSGFLRGFSGGFSSRRANSGFTLIELLIVVILIGILSTMTALVIRVALRTGKASAVQMQLQQLSIALDNYKNKFGEYPPDFSDSVAVMRHVKKRWPRSLYSVDAAGFTAFCADINAHGSPSTPWNFGGPGAAYVGALVFWLGGLPGEDGQPEGFFLSPTNPLGAGVPHSPNDQHEEPFFKFPDGSVVVANGIPGFVPGKTDDKPVVYFRAENRDYTGKYWEDPRYQTPSPDPDCLGVAAPYAKTATLSPPSIQWYEEDRFQLIHPGNDGLFSVTALRKDPPSLPLASDTTPRVVGTQQKLSLEDADNITNFTSGQTLDSEY